MTDHEQRDEQQRKRMGSDDAGGDPAGAGAPTAGATQERGGNVGGSVGAGDRGGERGSDRKVDDALPGDTQSHKALAKAADDSTPPAGDLDSDPGQERGSTGGRPIITTTGGDVTGSPVD